MSDYPLLRFAAAVVALITLSALLLGSAALGGYWKATWSGRVQSLHRLRALAVTAQDLRRSLDAMLSEAREGPPAFEHTDADFQRLGSDISRAGCGGVFRFQWSARWGDRDLLSGP